MIIGIMNHRIELHRLDTTPDAMGGRDAKIDHTIDALIQHIALSKSYKESEGSP